MLHHYNLNLVNTSKNINGKHQNEKKIWNARGKTTFEFVTTHNIIYLLNNVKLFFFHFLLLLSALTQAEKHWFIVWLSLRLPCGLCSSFHRG